MAGSLLRLSVLLFFFARWAEAAAPPVCEDIQKESNFQLGVALQWALPGNVPGLPSTFNSYGLLAQARIWGPLLIYGQPTYSYTEGTTAYFLDGGLKMELPNPFLRAFLTAGVDYFRFSNGFVTSSRTSINGGFGIGIRMGESVEIPLSLRGSFQAPLMTYVGGGLLVLL